MPRWEVGDVCVLVDPYSRCDGEVSVVSIATGWSARWLGPIRVALFNNGKYGVCVSDDPKTSTYARIRRP